MGYLFFAIFGYLTGGILFAYLIPKKVKGIDIRKESRDGNPGTANAFLYAGVPCGILVLVCDLLKGAIPVHLAVRTLDVQNPGFILVMAAPVLGHVVPVFRGYAGGGKGIAVSFGVLLGLWPGFPCIWLLAFWYLFFSLVFVLNPHSFRTIAAFWCWAVSELFFIKSTEVLLGSAMITLLVWRRHRKEDKKEEREIRFVFRRN